MLMKFFRGVSLCEGVSTLLLFLLAMPLKYGAGYDALIRPIGMLHGALFVLYIAVMIIAFSANRVRPVGWVRSFVASLYPFGTFINDRWLKREVERHA